MAYFPFMVDIKGKQCLVAGGGGIALHKVRILLGFEADIKVVAPEICEELKTLEGDSLKLVEREFLDVDVEDADFVIAATDEETLNYHISDLCRQRGILVNAVDMKEACSFIFPALIQDKDLLVAISSGGQSPAAVSFVKNRIKESMPEYFGEMLEQLGAYRDFVLEHVDTAGKRKAIFYRLLEYGDSHGGSIPETLVQELVRSVNEGDGNSAEN